MSSVNHTPPPSREDFHPAIARHDESTGEVSGVPRSQVEGLDEFIANWQKDTELPELLTFSGWQEDDEEHPAGAGERGYRVIFKTIRTVPMSPLCIEGGNFRVRVHTAPVTWGEPRYTTAIPGRRDHEWLVPEWQLVEDPDGGSEVLPRAPLEIAMEAHQETTPACSHVEILLKIGDDETTDYRERLAAGRARIAPMTAALDLMCGERVMGPVLTEEIGELFDDWHWNRWLGGRGVAWEPQARLKRLDTAHLTEFLMAFLDVHHGRTPEDMNRVRIASQWYWLSEREGDPVIRFVGYWLAIEALELSQNSNIAPVKRAVADILEVNTAVVAEKLGRVYGDRNRLLHGQSRSVSKDSLDLARAMTAALLEKHLIGEASVPSVEDLRSFFDDTSGWIG